MVFSATANAVNFDIKAKIDSFLKLNPHISNNTNINNLWMNVTDSAKILPFVQEISEQQKKAYLGDKAYFTREDLVEEVMRIIYPSEEYKKIINALDGFIPQKDISALLISARICKMEDDLIKFNELKEKHKLTEAYSTRGLTLYNWLRSGDVFPLDILPFIEAKINFSDNVLFNQLFNTFWESMINLHPHRIFVNMNMNKDDLIREILTRAIFKESKKIIVYSRCSRNHISQKVEKDLKTSYTLGKKIRWKNKKKKYKIGNNPAIKLELVPTIS